MPCDEKVLENMLASMARRGPDGRDIFRQGDTVLLHTRLAVIDLRGGAQPMHLCWERKHYTITYNGELYNAQELRLQLQTLGHEFAGHSDTEVVLHAYAQWGENSLERLNGIFAFGIWEQENRRLFLARDRIGVKPLFYALRGSGILFASEIKTILCHPEVQPCLDANGAAQLLMLGPGRLPGSGVFRDVQEMMPGWCGYFSEGKLTLRRYWHLTDREHVQSFEETSDHVRELVLDSIRRQMVSDVPIGTFLSGGLDSSIISAVCAREMEDGGKVLDTFSVDYLNNDQYFVSGKFQPESDGTYISLMHRTLRSRHHWTMLTTVELLEELGSATCARDLPGMADVDFSLLAFCRQIRREVKVALSGECADEIFGGYPWYRDPEIRKLEGFPWAQNVEQRIKLMHPDLRRAVDGRALVMDAYSDSCRDADVLPGTSPQERRMKEMVNLNFAHFMQTLLDRKDRMSMYCGLEVRVPFCDYRIAEYLYGVPWEFKEWQGKEKGLLRHAMQALLPEKVLWRKKSPYPKTFDPAYSQAVSRALGELLEQKDAPLFHLVDREQVKNMFTSEPVWPWYGQLMRTPQTFAWLLQLDFWLRRYDLDICF